MKIKNASTILSCIAIILSLFAIGVCLFVNRNNTFDSMMFAIAMLSAMVVVLMGWNIWNSVRFNETIRKEIDIVKHEIKQELDKRTEVTEDNLTEYLHRNMYTIFINLGHSMLETKYCVSAIVFYCKAIAYVPVMDNGNEGLTKSIKWVHLCIDMIEKKQSNDSTMSPDIKKVCINLVSQANNKDAITIITYISNLPE